MPGVVDTSGLRRHLARELRRLREDQAGLSVEHAARKVGWKRDMLWLVECGDILPYPQDVTALCEIYDADAHMTGCLVAIARHTRNPLPLAPDPFDPRTLERAAAACW